MSNPQSKYVIDTSDGLLTDAFGDNVEEIFSNLRPEVPLVVFFHGALVDRPVGLKYADDLRQVFADRGDHIAYVYDSDVMRELLKASAELLSRNLVAQILSKVSGAIGGALTPVFGMEAQDPEEQLKAEIEQDGVIREELKAFVRNDRAAIAFSALEGEAPLSPEDSIRARVDASIAAALTPEDAPRNGLGFGIALDWRALLGQAALRAVAIYRAVRARQDAGRDHGLPQTVIEEVVRAFVLVPQIWSTIKAEVGTSFSNKPKAAGTKLVAALVREQEQNPDRMIYLVGHSTGAIYVANTILAAKELGATGKFHVRLLAGAATMSLYARLFREADALVGSIRTYGLGDEKWEREERLFNIGQIPVPAIKNLYVGSLLYMVSGALEDVADQPLVGMERFFTLPEESLRPREKADVKLVRSKIKDRVWSKVESKPGSTAEGHGGFPRDKATQEGLLD
ncbi:MAG: hypothetical protein ACOYON_12640 [Fimbriimonas sp.]